MNRSALAAFALLAPFLSAAELPVIPRPAKVVEAAGTYALPASVKVSLKNVPDDRAAIILATLTEAGLKAAAAGAGETATITFEGDASNAAKENYTLKITSTGIVISGPPAGLFYGAETLAGIVAAAPKTTGGFTLPLVVVDDAPRFAWRGYMLDESRHFSGEKAVKRLLDAMARYKLNRFHWHLTDSPGWRIEIKKYPKLTSVGGRGDESVRDPKAPAQFYTQAQIRDIVAYANARNIVVIPEIDMPGHADAAVLAYPELDGGGFVQKGSTTKWPHFTFNPASPKVLSFLDDVLKEVSELFRQPGNPTPVIHMGGDEVNFGWKKWPELPEVADLMKRDKLKDNAAVETWFNRRMAATVNGLGYDVGGWDEIAERDLDKTKTVVFWWRHDKPQIMRKALDAGYPVVLCPRRPLYFDFIQQKEHKVGRVWGGFNPLADVYEFPAPLKLTAAQESKVLGIQACLWTETMRDQERRDFMTWPRLVAVAEAGWTPADRKDYASFETRLKPELAVLKSKGITAYDPFLKSPEVRDRKAVKTADALDQPE